jgi:polar amino acid transport system substrate-binding protein
MKWLAALIITFNFASQSWAGLPVITVSGLDVEPYIIKTEGSEGSSGIIIDIVNEVMSRVGYQPKYNISVWARAFNDVSKGFNDALIPAMKTADREQLLWYPEEPLLSLRMSLFKAKNATVAWDGIMDSLQNANIAVVREAKVSPDFDQVVDSGLFNVEKRTDFDLVMKAVAARRVDYGAADQLMGLWAAKNYGILNQVEVAKPYLEEVPVYIAFSKEKVNAEFVSRFNDALLIFKAEGGVQKIIDSYFSNGVLYR